MRNMRLPGGSTIGSRRRSSSSLTSPALVASLNRRSAASPVRTLSIPARVSRRASVVGSSRESARSGAADLPFVVEARLDGTSTDLVHTRHLGLVGAGAVLVLLSLGVAVEVQIGHDLPFGVAGGDGAAQAQDLAGQHPPDETDGVATLVVGGNGNVDELGGRVGVAEGDDGDVDVGGLLDGLGVGAGVRHDDEAGLLERAGDVVGEVTGGETTGNGGSTGVGGELQDGTLTVGTGADAADIGRVVDGGDDTGSEDDLLPVVRVLAFRSRICANCGSRSFALGARPTSRGSRLWAPEHMGAKSESLPGLLEVQNVHTVGPCLPDVRLHVHLRVLGAEVALRRQQHLNVLGRRIEDGGKVGRGHDVEICS